MIRLSRRYSFCASHRLHSSALSEERNRAIYGKCNNPFGHGHDYEVEITVEGPVNAQTGRVVSLAELDRLVEEQILAPFRYRNLNEEIAAFQDAVPTTENLAIEVERRLRMAWAGMFEPGPRSKMQPRLKMVRIWETERNICNVESV